MLRGDSARLERSMAITTGGKPDAQRTADTVKRSKPFFSTYEKEIVMCARSFRLVSLAESL